MYDAANDLYGGNLRTPCTGKGKIQKNNGRGKTCLMILSVMLSLGICAFAIITVLQASNGGSSTEQTLPEILASPGAGEIEAEELILTEQETQKPPVVMLDAGHGGEDGGCIGAPVPEKEVNLEIALLVKTKLENLGYQVLMTRDTDTYMAKEDRVELANRLKPDIFVSIHQNDYEDTSISGIETWYDASDTARNSKRLAQLVQQETQKSTNALERGLQDGKELCVTGKTQMPACLVETGFLSNPEESVLLLDAAYQEKIADGIVSGIVLYFEPRTMYLTFDDGPSAENTNAVLDILRDRNIKATFFVVGENVRKNPETARRIAEEGHTIGIHCNRHDYEKIYESADAYLEDFKEAFDTVREVTGQEPVLYRFPGGSINAYNEPVREEIIEEMRELGFIYYDWNCSLEDAVRDAEPQELINTARETALERKKVVLLAHDVVGNTALCLDSLIEAFPEYRMEPLTPELNPVQFR